MYKVKSLSSFLLVTAMTWNIPVQAEEVEIAIEKYEFRPAEITVKKGDKVRWVNREKRQYHSVKFEGADGVESEYFFPDESFEMTFDKPGEYRYRCGPHEQMRGIVHVVE